jgi:hypothetical protein
MARFTASTPWVNAIVHSHSPAVIPFGVSRTPLKPLYHMSGFLDAGQDQCRAGQPSLGIMAPEGDGGPLTRTATPPRSS